MTTAVTGLTLSLEDAKRQLTDNRGNHIEFEEDEKTGTWTGKIVYDENDKDKKDKQEEAEKSKYEYKYSLSPQATIVTVSVAKILKEEAEKAKQQQQQSKPVQPQATNKKL